MIFSFRRIHKFSIQFAFPVKLMMFCYIFGTKSISSSLFTDIFKLCMLILFNMLQVFYLIFKLMPQLLFYFALNCSVKTAFTTINIQAASACLTLTRHYEIEVFSLANQQTYRANDSCIYHLINMIHRESKIREFCFFFLFFYFFSISNRVLIYGRFWLKSKPVYATIQNFYCEKKGEKNS